MTGRFCLSGSICVICGQSPKAWGYRYHDSDRECPPVRKFGRRRPPNAAMNPLPRRPPPPGRLRHPALAALAATASAFGQVAPSRPAPADQGRKEMVTLFPFLVSTDRETGWSANDTLSATRTKQALKDVPVNIDAITADFIEDLGLNTADEVANYVANAYAPPTLENDNHSGAIAFRGLTGLTTTRNYFRWCILSDTYNVERIDFGKGSNSLIFGDVEPGGQASVFTKRALIPIAPSFWTLTTDHTDGPR